MIRLNLVTLVVICGALSVGWSDCGSTYVQATFHLTSCPPANFVWPQGAKSDTYQANLAPFRYPEGNSFECRKLVHYHVKQKYDHRMLLTHIEWMEHEAYMAILRSSDECSMLLSLAVVGSVPESEAPRLKERLTKVSDAVLDLLFNNEPFKVERPAKSIAVVRGSSDYKAWCEALSPLEIKQ